VVALGLTERALRSCVTTDLRRLKPLRPQRARFVRSRHAGDPLEQMADAAVAVTERRPSLRGDVHGSASWGKAETAWPLRQGMGGRRTHSCRHRARPRRGCADGRMVEPSGVHSGERTSLEAVALLFGWSVCRGAVHEQAESEEPRSMPWPAKIVRVDRVRQGRPRPRTRPNERPNVAALPERPVLRLRRERRGRRLSGCPGRSLTRAAAMRVSVASGRPTDPCVRSGRR